MFALWAVAGILSAAAAGLILFRAAGAASGTDRGDASPSVYRRQLAEIDDLAGRGLMEEPERKSAHAEAARRLLAAADHKAAPWTFTGARSGVLAAAILTPLAALALYFAVGSPGSPGSPDQPYAARLAAWRGGDLARLGPPELAAVLRQAVTEHPGDAEGYRYLGLAEGAAGDGPAAVRAMRHAAKLAPQRAELWTLLGVALIYEAQGEVTSQAQAAFREALRRDPASDVARFHLAEAQAASGDVAGGIAAWRAMIAAMPAGDPRRGYIEKAIADASQPAAGPAADQMVAIRGMVEGLAQRLASQPDDPEGWVRLVRAYAVLGESARRDAVLAQARTRYAARPDVLQELAAAAAAKPMEPAK